MAIFDDDLRHATCPVCSQEVVFLKGEHGEQCPICKIKEASARFREPGTVAAGPWPHLVLLRGELPRGTLWISLEEGESDLDLGEGPLATLVRSGEKVSLLSRAADLKVDGAPVPRGGEAQLEEGAVVSVASRELLYSLA